MNTDQTKAEQNFITCATSMQKFMHEYALISSGEFDEIGHTAMKHPVDRQANTFEATVLSKIALFPIRLVVVFLDRK